jgi:hypothetical protein
MSKWTSAGAQDFYFNGQALPRFFFLRQFFFICGIIDIIFFNTILAIILFGG